VLLIFSYVHSTPNQFLMSSAYWTKYYLTPSNSPAYVSLATANSANNYAPANSQSGSCWWTFPGYYDNNDNYWTVGPGISCCDPNGCNASYCPTSPMCFQNTYCNPPVQNGVPNIDPYIYRNSSNGHIYLTTSINGAPTPTGTYSCSNSKKRDIVELEDEEDENGDEEDEEENYDQTPAWSISLSATTVILYGLTGCTAANVGAPLNDASYTSRNAYCAYDCIIGYAWVINLDPVLGGSGLIVSASRTHSSSVTSYSSNLRNAGTTPTVNGCTTCASGSGTVTTSTA